MRAREPSSRLDEAWWLQRHHARLDEIARRPPSLALYGDSIFHNLDARGPSPLKDFRGVWDKHFAARGTANLGFAGDTTSNLIWRLQNGQSCPTLRAAVVLIGTNDILVRHDTAEAVVEGTLAAVSLIRAAAPDCSVLILGMLPAGDSGDNNRTRRDANQKMRQAAASGAVSVLDPAPLFMSGDALRTELFYDPFETPPRLAVHPTPEGMALLAEAIEPALRRVGV